MKIDPYNDIEMRTLNDVRGGSGPVYRWDIKPGGEPMPGQWKALAIMELPKGSSIGEHAHDGETEQFYVIEGEPTYTRNGEIFHGKEGDLLIYLPGDTHSIKNDGEGRVRILAMFVRN